VGGFLVAVAAVIVFVAALAGTSSPGQAWLVASRPLAAGTTLGPGDLGEATMRLPRSTAALAFRDPARLVGRTLVAGLQTGELIQAPMLVPSDQTPTLRPVSVAVNPVSLANLSPGQLVDVLATQGSGGSSTVSVVVRGATLMDMVTSGSALLAPGGSGQVTIGVGSLEEVEAVVQASQAGTVSLVAAERSDGVGPGSGGAGS
jgi:Flp pilus assembly protein CpaB